MVSTVGSELSKYLFARSACRSDRVGKGHAPFRRVTEPAAQTAGSTRSPSRDVRATPQPFEREGMAMTIVDSSRPIVGGVDTHLDNHVAAALDAHGGVLGVESFPTTTGGFVALHEWLCRFGPVARVGVEGTGAYGAGLSRYLQSCGLVVIEVD